MIPDRRPTPTPMTTTLPQPAHRVSDRVAETILSRINRGELEPGQRLPGERQLAEQMNVSRVSARAALQRLKTQGFLKAVQGGGTRVVSSAETMDTALTTLVRSGMDNLRDLAEIRIALETWAARRAAARAGGEQLSQMAEALDRMVEAGGHSAAADADMDFHLALARAADSPVFLHIMAVIREILDQMRALHQARSFGEGLEALLIDQHRAILEAVKAKNADAAAEAVAEHLDWILDRYGGAPRSRAGERHLIRQQPYHHTAGRTGGAAGDRDRTPRVEVP